MPTGSSFIVKCALKEDNGGFFEDDATLDKYLESPRVIIPATKMTYAGVKDAGKRADLIAYLDTLK